MPPDSVPGCPLTMAAPDASTIETTGVRDCDQRGERRGLIANAVEHHAPGGRSGRAIGEIQHPVGIVRRRVARKILHGRGGLVARRQPVDQPLQRKQQRDRGRKRLPGRMPFDRYRVSARAREALGKPQVPAPQPARIETQGEFHVPDRCSRADDGLLLIRFSQQRTHDVAVTLLRN